MQHAQDWLNEAHDMLDDYIRRGDIQRVMGIENYSKVHRQLDKFLDYQIHQSSAGTVMSVNYTEQPFNITFEAKMHHIIPINRALPKKQAQKLADELPVPASKRHASKKQTPISEEEIEAFREFLRQNPSGGIAGSSSRA